MTDIVINRPSQAKLIDKRGYVCCSRKCSGIIRCRGGLVRAKTDATNLLRYGVTNPAISASAREKCRLVTLKKHGVEHYFQSDEFKTKAKATWQRTLGVDNPLKFKEFHDAGVEAARQPDIRQRAQETYRSNFDVNPFQHALELTHGVSNASQLPDAHRWLNTPQACAKRHETMKQRGSYVKSLSEDAYHICLCELHGSENILRQVTVPGTRWAIDFYIKSTNTYVQFDGAYWHGLDRSLEEIVQHRTKRDVVIHRKWLTDREQDEWFKTHGLKLVRITDRQFRCQNGRLS